jgi:mono/diheme cytochrome c family protein
VISVLALSTAATLALAATAIVGLAFAGFLVAAALRRRGERKPDIPSGMKPGPADEVLERRQLERVMGWGIVFTLFFAAWIPVLWLREPSQNLADELDLVDRAVHRGRQWFLPSSPENPFGYGCANCHGVNAEGGTTRFTTPDGETVPNYPVPPLNNVCGGPNTGHPQIKSIEDIRTTIMEGRQPETPMPSWSVQFEGPMSDQQIEDLIRYLVSIQQGVPDNQNVCTNPAAAQAAATPQPGPSPGPTGAASPGAEESPAGSPSPSPTG